MCFSNREPLLCLLLRCFVGGVEGSIIKIVSEGTSTPHLTFHPLPNVNHIRSISLRNGHQDKLFCTWPAPCFGMLSDLWGGLQALCTLVIKRAAFFLIISINKVTETACEVMYGRGKQINRLLSGGFSAEALCGVAPKGREICRWWC